MKRLLTIQDLSCVGRCSLAVAIPVISAAGVETVALPTALLSMHTAFSDPFIKPLDDALLPVAKAWKANSFTFDCVYTGYLASKQQAKTVLEIAEMFKTEDNLFIVDPVMADNGVLYRGFDSDFVDVMRGITAHADIILPNVTEAALLAGEEYKTEYTEDYLKKILEKLTESGCTAIITGVSLKEGSTGVYGLNRKAAGFFAYQTTLLSETYHGTGDIFASAFSAAVTKGQSVHEASVTACEFTAACIRNTEKCEDKRFGVNLEETLPLISKLIENKTK